MNSIVFYQSKNGASKIYAQWLAENKKAKLKKFDEVTQNDFKLYDNYFIFSGTYGGQMPLVKFLKDNWIFLKQKNITAIAVGMVPHGHWWSKISYYFIPKYIRFNIKYFKLLGFDPNKPETKKAIKKENLSVIN